ncbi:MAG: FHA domain-containing protein [Anaerolineae bacterium]|nr:FHA domain-containing protein [Anaerolineae bacterium]
MANIYKLIIQSGTGTGTEFPLEKNELFLGRDLTSDLVINDPEVSRRHLRLVLDGATYRLEDLGSTNGTFMHGQRLTTPTLLKPGEVITLGEKIVLRYEVISTDPNATVVAQRGVSSSTQPGTAPVVPPVHAAPPSAVRESVIAPPPERVTPPISAVPAYQAPNMQTPPTAAPKKKSPVLVIILILVGIVVLFCILPWIIIDATNSYCSLFPGIMNMLITNACAV